MMVSISALALFALTALAASQKCKPHDVPFNSSLVGKSFYFYGGCSRQYTVMAFVVQDSVLLYYPVWNFRAAGTKYAPYCRELYVYHFRKHDMLPFIEHYKPMGVFEVLGFYPSRYSTSEADKICKRRQKPVKYSVWGRTRSNFIASVRRFVKELPRIRDKYLCGPLMENPQRFLKNPRMQPVDVFINFFIAVGYTHFFCAQ